MDAAGGGSERPARYAQGQIYEGTDPKALALAIEAAFDYRGDVTLLLAGGGEVRGYLSNRSGGAADPFVDLFPADGSPRRRIPYREIRGVVFSGRDTAAGKSWETWVKSYNAKREAQARGEKTGAVGLFPEPLDG